MAYKVLYRKYRPNDFNELVGQKPIKDALINAITKNQLSHAYIFTGPRGTGKTSMAKIFAKALTCLNPIDGICCNKCSNCLSFNENPDIIEIDAASNNGVDEIREIRNNVKLVPTMSKYKIYIVDEVHMLSNSAWNAFLKTLEEPPSHVIFVFATTEINKVPITVLSRCQRYDFHKIQSSDIKNHVLNISSKEGIKIDDNACDELIKLSDGCLRDALSYLDQLSKLSSNIDLNLITDFFGVASLRAVKDILSSVKNNDINSFLIFFDNIKSDGIDCNNLINNMIEYLIEKAIKIKKKQTDEFTFEFCYDLINNLLNAQKNIKYLDNPYNALQILFLNYFETVTDNSINKKNDKNIISREIKVVNNEKNISREIKKDNFDKLKQIRVNNVFCGANKNLKKEFSEKWKEFLNIVSDNNNYSLFGYIENVNIEVVSSQYVLFSTKVNSDSVVFNSNLDIIELEFNNYYKTEYKFIALDSNEWQIEKDKFIKTKNQQRSLINENILKGEENKDYTFDIAQDIFGDIIEVD